MKAVAAVLEQPNTDLVLHDVELDTICSDEVLVRIEAVGICHSDLVVSQGHSPAVLPVVLGHEGVGTVEEVGPSVRGWRPGDRAVLSYSYCGSCGPCRMGRPSTCDDFVERNLVGRVRSDGSPAMWLEDGSVVNTGFFGQSSLATLAICQPNNLVRLPDGVPAEVAAPFGCGFQTGAGAVLGPAGLRRDETALVVGAGGVGLSALLAARLAGAAQIVVVDPIAARRVLARELGATAVIDPAAVDMVEAVLDLVPGGVDHAFETTGIEGVIRQATGSLRRTGTLALIGIRDFSTQVTVSLLEMLSGRTVRGVAAGDAVPQELIPRLVDHWQRGEFPIEGLIHTFEFAEVTAALGAMHRGEVVKPVVVMGS